MEGSVAFPFEASVDVVVSKAGRKAAEINQEIRPSASTALRRNSSMTTFSTMAKKLQW